MELRNIQEQVAKNQEDIKTLKSGIKIEYWCNGLVDLGAILTESNVGKYAIVDVDDEKHLYLITKRTNDDLIAVDMGLYPAVVQGQKGDKGDNGSNGERGSTIYGVSINPPSDAKIGDFYIQKKIVDGATDYVLNKLDGSRTWRPQFSMRGPQGLPGVSEEIVIANPEGEATEALNKIDINGVNYLVGPNDGYEYLSVDISTGNVSYPLANNLVFYDYANIEFWGTDILIDEITSIKDEDGVPYFSPYIQKLKDLDEENYTVLEYISGLFIANYEDYYLGLNKSLYLVNYASLYITDNTYLKDLDGNNLLEIEAFKDSNGHNRFIEGTCPIDVYFNGTITYNKWSLSGTHLMVVLSGTLNAGTQTGTISVLGTNSIPEWILDKIYPVSSHYIDFPKIRAFSDWQSVELDLQVDKYDSPKRLVIGFSSSQSIDVDRKFRYELDLLIDND